VAEWDSGLPKQEQRWSERLIDNGEALFGENKALLRRRMVVQRRLVRWLRGTNQQLLWNPNDHNSVERGSTMADVTNGG